MLFSTLTAIVLSTWIFQANADLKASSLSSSTLVDAPDALESSAGGSVLEKSPNRPVYLNLYEMPSPLDRVPAIRDVFIPYAIYHTEVELGEFEYGILVPANGPSKIRIRKDKRSRLHWPIGIADYVNSDPLCSTNKTDSQLRKHLHTYTGEYCLFRRNCNDLAEHAIAFLCPHITYPNTYRIAEKYLKRYPFLKMAFIKPRDKEKQYRVVEYKPHAEYTQERQKKRLSRWRRFWRWLNPRNWFRKRSAME